MSHTPGASTRVFALLGDPVAHSRSPRFQNAALEHLGLDGVYVALRCGAEDAPGLVVALARAGGGGNITVPHKPAVLPVLERTTEAVDRTGACNTFWLEHGRVCGDNTDVAGFRQAVAEVCDPAGADVLLIGAGGAARAAVFALLGAPVRRVLILNRNADRARSLIDQFGDGRIGIAGALQDLEADLVVNATALGLHDGDALPIDLDRLRRVGAVFDVVYRSGGTALVAAARAHGVPAADGGEMLVQQGAAAFERWWGREAPIEVMRAAALGSS